MATVPDSPPTTELGAVHPFATPGVPGWSHFMFEREKPMELRGSQRVETYEAMWNDTQLEGLYLGTTLPVRRYRWALDPQEANEELVARLSRDLGLPILDGKPPQGRTKGRFSFPDHLRIALKALGYGSYYFEQVAEIYEEGGRQWARLRKLAPRPPRSIVDIKVAPDGGLEAIKQLGSFLLPGDDRGTIPVSRLVAYVWDHDPGEWYGRSIFRSSFRNWAVKDRLIRVDAMKHERMGMGVVVTKGGEGDDDTKAKALLATGSRVRAGEEAAAYIEHDQSLTIEGVRGTVPDTIAALRYHDEQMAKAFLMMFMNLGMTETGSRALGESFIDFFDHAQQALADWFRDTFVTHVIEDWVTWNYGPDEPCPGLIYNRGDDEDLSVTDLATLVEKGLITVTPEIEDVLRERFNLPAKADGSSVAQPGTAASELSARESRRRREPMEFAAARSLDELRRQPTEQEVAAAVDFAAMEQSFVDARDKLVSEVVAAQDAQITELGNQIEAASGELDKLTAITATPVGADIIRQAMAAHASDALDRAMAEAQAQGREATRPDAPDFTDRADAKAALLAGRMTESARGRAVALTEEADAPLNPGEVAAQTRDHLNSLTTAFPELQMTGALMEAENSARRAVFAANPPRRIFASEILDGNTCASCRSIDGTEYPDLEAAEQDYPTGAYAFCEGGLRCRGTLIAEWGG